MNMTEVDLNGIDSRDHHVEHCMYIYKQTNKYAQTMSVVIDDFWLYGCGFCFTLSVYTASVA